MNPGTSGRSGFSLVELLVAFAVFGVIFATAVAIMGQETRTFAAANEQSIPLQNARFSADQMERAFRTAGISLGSGQPTLVYADSNTVVFNGNYMSNTPNDMDAIFVDPGTSESATTAMRAPATTLPNSTFAYPDTTYRSGADPAYAETIMFFLRPDSSTSRTDDYVLFRQVNREPAEPVAENILHNGSAAFFQYWRIVAPASGPTYLDTIPTGSLPLAHTARMHLEKGDTAPFSIIDSVRAVKVNLVATNGLTGKDEARLAVSRLISIPNAGLAAFNICGDAPLAPGPLTIAWTSVNGVQVPELQWTPSADENGGERDVYRYVVYRSVGSPTFTDPFISIPSGSGNYVFDDTQVEPNTQYYYAVAAQDCTPQVGSMTAAVGALTPP